MYTIFKQIINLAIDLKIRLLAIKSPRRVVVGAGGVRGKGWISTDIAHLNLLDVKTWKKYFSLDSIDAIIAEHVWEHLTEQDAYIAASNCFAYLKPNAYLRVAVPDGFSPSANYINAVKPGGIGAGSEDHKVLYNYLTFSEVFKSVGFEVDLLEYFDEEGRFHYKEWNIARGLIKRSMIYDERNQQNSLNYTSIIIDAWKKS